MRQPLGLRDLWQTLPAKRWDFRVWVFQKIRAILRQPPVAIVSETAKTWIWLLVQSGDGFNGNRQKYGSTFYLGECSDSCLPLFGPLQVPKGQPWFNLSSPGLWASSLKRRVSHRAFIKMQGLQWCPGIWYNQNFGTHRPSVFALSAFRSPYGCVLKLGRRWHQKQGSLKDTCCNHLNHGFFNTKIKGHHHLQVAMFRCIM